jgi:GT2 family glycosyltransferase/ADP-heptose:LPS heptosyltransferase
MNPLYTICVLCHNNLALTEKCLDSVFRSTDLARAEVVVINNASTDGTKEYLRSLGEQGRIGLIQTGENLWIGTAYNLGLQVAHAPYFVTLNNDIEILDADWLKKMRQPFLDDPKMALVGAMDTCGELDAMGAGFQGGSVDYIEGSCMMARTNLLRRHGFFDPVYRLGYCEDTDLSLRMRKRGYSIAQADIKISHVRGATSKIVQDGGVDIEGYQLINFVTFNKRWNRYLKTRNFMERIAICRTGAIGDVIQLTPLLRAIRQENAHAKIHVFTDCPDVLRNNPDVFSIGPASDYRFFYEICDKAVNLDLAYELRPELSIIDAYADCAKVPIVDKRMHVYPGVTEREWARGQLQGPRWVAIHPHSGQVWPGKNWNGFNELAKRLHEQRWRVVLVGSDSSAVESDLDLRGKTTFHQLASIVERCDMFIGVDSAPMNIAQASLVPTVGIFGSTDPAKILIPIPFIRPARVTMDTVGCLGCHSMYTPPRCTPHCIRETDLCMDRLTVERVLNVACEALLMRTPYSETTKFKHLVERWCTGKGIDIGCHRDPLNTECIAFDDDPWPEVTVLGDARKLPFRAEYFDYVFSSHLIEDVDDTEALLAEWVRVVKLGGRIVVACPYPGRFTGFNAEHVHDGFTTEQLAEYLTAAGCETIEKLEYDYSSIVVARKEKR